MTLVLEQYTNVCKRYCITSACATPKIGRLDSNSTRDNAMDDQYTWNVKQTH